MRLFHKNEFLLLFISVTTNMILVASVTCIGRTMWWRLRPVACGLSRGGECKWRQSIGDYDVRLLVVPLVLHTVWCIYARNGPLAKGDDVAPSCVLE